jgi:DNA (cytosine-5)-methyltransferase 1
MENQINSPTKASSGSAVGTFGELFAGVGGFRLGLEKHGWKAVFSNQWEPGTKAQHASDVYVYRFGQDGHSNVDIEKLVDEYEFNSNESALPDVDLLVGGFPCQDYSVAKSLGSSHGLAGKKGVLWWQILRIVSLKKPRMLFLENVDRLLKSPASQRGRDFAVMLASLADEGYSVEWRVVNAADYGFPQRRRRVFIVARLEGTAFEPELSQKTLVSSGAIAKALPVEANLGEHRIFAIDGDLPGISDTFNVGGKQSPFLNAGVMNGRDVFTANTSPLDFPLAGLETVLVPDAEVPDSFFIEESSIPDWEWHKGAKRIERVSSSGHKYVYSEGKMSFPDDSSLPSRTILTGEGGSSASRFKHVIRADSGGFRRLLPIELERLNGFPDDWTRWTGEGLEATAARRAFFMGNALVVGVVEKIGEQLAAELDVQK